MTPQDQRVPCRACGASIGHPCVEDADGVARTVPTHQVRGEELGATVYLLADARSRRMNRLGVIANQAAVGTRVRARTCPDWKGVIVDVRPTEFPYVVHWDLGVDEWCSPSELEALEAVSA